MKTLLIVTNTITLILLLYVSFFREELSIKPKNCDTFSYNYSKKPFEKVPFKVVNNLMDNYKKRWDEKHKQQDSRWVWFSIDKLKQFIYAIENTGCQDCLKGKQLGVRFYFVEYPDSTLMKGEYSNHFKGVPTTYAQQHNLLLVPTYNKGNINIDFDIESSKKQCKYVSFGDLYLKQIKSQKPNEKGESVGMMMAGIDEMLSVTNKGGMGPPPYNDSGDYLMNITDKY